MQWSPVPLDSLLDVDGIINYWRPRGLVLHKVGRGARHCAALFGWWLPGAPYLLARRTAPVLASVEQRRMHLSAPTAAAARAAACSQHRCIFFHLRRRRR